MPYVGAREAPPGKGRSAMAGGSSHPQQAEWMTVDKPNKPDRLWGTTKAHNRGGLAFVCFGQLSREWYVLLLMLRDKRVIWVDRKQQRGPRPEDQGPPKSRTTMLFHGPEGFGQPSDGPLVPTSPRLVPGNHPHREGFYRGVQATGR
jgi:hypothetical protein